jgi:CMP-N-acetylneuraminic acid synthetase
VKRNQRRQNCKQIYTVNGSIFIAKVCSFLDSKTFHGKDVIGYEMDPFHSIDINTHKDLELAEILFNYSRSDQSVKKDKDGKTK